MIVFALVISLPFALILARRPVLRRLALRNAVRRPRETVLVIAGSMLATALMTAAFVVGDTFNASIKVTAYTQLGPADEVVRAPLGAAGDAVVQRLDRLECGTTCGCPQRGTASHPERDARRVPRTFLGFVRRCE